MVLGRAVFDARVRTAPLCGFALCHRIVSAFLARSGFQAEVVMDVVAPSLRKGTRTRNRSCCDDRSYHPLPPTRAPSGAFLVQGENRD